MAELSKVSMDFLAQQRTSDDCRKGKKMLESIAPALKDDPKRTKEMAELRELWKMLDIRQRRLTEEEADKTETCFFCKGRTVVYQGTDSWGHHAVMPEQTDYYTLPVTCPMCKGLGRRNPKGNGQSQFVFHPALRGAR